MRVRTAERLGSQTRHSRLANVYTVRFCRGEKSWIASRHSKLMWSRPYNRDALRVPFPAILLSIFSRKSVNGCAAAWTRLIIQADGLIAGKREVTKSSLCHVPWGRRIFIIKVLVLSRFTLPWKFMESPYTLVFVKRENKKKIRQLSIFTKS